jgi:hypothetical protein
MPFLKGRQRRRSISQDLKEVQSQGENVGKEVQEIESFGDPFSLA